MNVGLALSHVGVTVTDLDGASKWYATLLGFEMRIPPTQSSTHTADAALMRTMLGHRFGSLRYAILSTGSGVFLEISESEEPLTGRAPQPAECWRTGPWHIAVTAPAIEDVARTIQDNGGRVLTPISSLAPTLRSRSACVWTRSG